jgi:hypothetical protein
MALSESDRVRMLEALAVDMTLKATQRLRAIEELGRIESRRRMAEGRGGQDDGGREDAADPMADLWEPELERRVRAQARGRRGRAQRAQA